MGGGLDCGAQLRLQPRRASDAADKQVMVDDRLNKFHWIDQKPGDDKENRNEQRLAEELQFRARRLVARRRIDRQPAISGRLWAWRLL